MTMPGATELMIVMVIALIIFGGGKLAGVGRSLGTAISEFKSAVKDEDKADPPDATKEAPVE